MKHQRNVAEENKNESLWEGKDLHIFLNTESQKQEYFSRGQIKIFDSLLYLFKIAVYNCSYNAYIKNLLHIFDMFHKYVVAFDDRKTSLTFLFKIIIIIQDAVQHYPNKTTSCTDFLFLDNANNHSITISHYILFIQTFSIRYISLEALTIITGFSNSPIMLMRSMMARLLLTFSLLFTFNILNYYFTEAEL